MCMKHDETSKKMKIRDEDRDSGSKQIRLYPAVGVHFNLAPQMVQIWRFSQQSVDWVKENRDVNSIFHSWVWQDLVAPTQQFLILDQKFRSPWPLAWPHGWCAASRCRVKATQSFPTSAGFFSTLLNGALLCLWTKVQGIVGMQNFS